MELWNRLKKAFYTDWKNRLYFSLAVGLAALALTSSRPEFPGGEPLGAWWGTMYPRFCFSSVPEEEEQKDREDRKEPQKVKISFWLAKALDWC